METDSIGHVFLIGINRPAKHNCVNQATAQQLYDAVKYFESDEELRVAVLYGKGLHYLSVTDAKNLNFVYCNFVLFLYYFL